MTRLVLPLRMTPNESVIITYVFAILLVLCIYVLRILSFMYEEVGGWSQVYEGLTLVTVRGAGHEVPLHKPRQGFTLFKSFLENKNMPLPIDSNLSGPTDKSLNKNIRLARPIRKITMPSSTQGFTY